MTAKTNIAFWERALKVFCENARPVNAGWAITFFKFKVFVI